MDDNELVIFRDLPDKTTPLNAYNLNHNFDVYNKKIETEAGKIDTTLQEIEKAKTDMQNDIDSKTQALEKNITEQITKTTENLESQITQSKEQLETDIGKQIASITSLSIEVVESLPTQNISKTTIYLIKPENLPQDMSINSVKKNLQAEKLVISPLSENSVSALAISQEDFYLACFYVNNDWVVVGSTTTDLSGYVKKNELATLETDPTVPSHVKSITMQNISNWNNKIGQTELEQLITNITNLDEYLKRIEKTTIYEGNLLAGSSITLSNVKRFLDVYFCFAFSSSQESMKYTIDTSLTTTTYSSSVMIASDESSGKAYYVSESSFDKSTKKFTHVRAGFFQLADSSYTSRTGNASYRVYRIDTYD